MINKVINKVYKMEIITKCRKVVKDLLCNLIIINLLSKNITNNFIFITLIQNNQWFLHFNRKEITVLNNKIIIIMIMINNLLKIQKNLK